MIEHYPIPQKVAYKRVDQLKSEGIKKVGIGLFIVDLDTKKIWTILEKEKKTITQRKIGETSIPMETRKTQEFIIDNVIGGLSEFRELKSGEELVWIDNGYSYRGRYPFVEGVVADVVLIGIRNRQIEKRLRLSNREVEPVGWKDINELISESRLRNGVGGFLELAKKEGWIDQFIEKARQGNDGQRIIRRGDEQLDYIKLRQNKRDIRLHRK